MKTKTIFNLICSSVLLVILIILVLAADFTPQGNINLRNIYNITGAKFVNSTIYYGSGASLTGLPGNASWNESNANSLYSGIEWDYNQTTATYNLYNSIWVSTYNSTYDSKTSFPGFSNIALTNQTNVFTANQNMNSKNITGLDCITFKSGGQICDLP